MLRKYEKYKDSGVEWIGQIPEGWEVKRLKYIASANPSNIDKKSIDGEVAVSLCNYVDVYKNELIDSQIDFMKATATNDQIQKFLLQEGDVILTKDSECPDDIGIPAFVSESFTDVVCGYHLTHVKPKHISGAYLFRQFQCKFQRSYFEVSANGVTRYGLGTDKFNSALILIPSPPEQTAIASFLDRKTSEVDQLIARKEKLIALYEEEKTAIINHAVTTGLDPKVKTKPSGIEWLGSIPEHWVVKKLKFITSLLNDGTHGTFKRTTSGYRLLSVRNIINDEFVFREDDSRVSEEDFISITKQFIVTEGDIQLAIVGATLGKVAMVPKLDESFATQRSVATIRTKQELINKKYLFYFLKSSSFQSFLWLNAGFSAQPGIYLGSLENCHIPTPNLLEQLTIVAHIETECARLDTMIEKFKKQIDLLKEYRTTLISEVVTGKIDVRYEVAA